MSQPSTKPEMPKLLESLLIRILWSMVSKAALRSNSSVTKLFLENKYKTKPNSVKIILYKSHNLLIVSFYIKIFHTQVKVQYTMVEKTSDKKADLIKC